MDALLLLHFLLNGQPVHLSIIVNGAKSADLSIILVSKHVTYSGEWLPDFAVVTLMSNASFGFAVHDDLIVTFSSALSDLIELLNVSVPALQLDREGRSQVVLACQREQVGHRVKLANLSPSVPPR